MKQGRYIELKKAQMYHLRYLSSKMDRLVNCKIDSSRITNVVIFNIRLKKIPATSKVRYKQKNPTLTIVFEDPKISYEPFAKENNRLWAIK